MAKLYTKGSTVVDEVLSGAEAYEIVKAGGGAIANVSELADAAINLTTSVAVAGTNLDAARMNNIENGIDAIDTRVDNLNTTVVDANNLLTTGGTTTAYTLTTTGAASLATGERFRMKFNATAGATPTLNRDSKGAKSLKYYDSAGAKQACTSSNIVANLITDVVYDGTDYVVLDPAGVSGSGGGDAKTGFSGLSGANNAATPNTKFDFSANMVALRNPSTSNVVVRTNTGTLTCDITLPASGSTSTANGCDQTKISALTSQWVHFYFIWNGTTLATLASLTPPPTGPTLPSGYTHWAYAGAARLNGSSAFMEVTLRGNRVFYNNAASETAIVNDTTDTTEQTASVSGMVPPNALTFNVEAAMTNSTGALRQMLIKYLTGKNLSAPQIATATILTTVYEMPNISQQFFWNWNGSGGTSIYITVMSYTVPNGAT